MRKISVFISTLLIIIMLCGCGGNSDKAKETISEIYEQTESVKPQAHYGISKNVYMVRHNEDDTYDYSPILGNVSISEDNSVIAYGTTIECSWMDDSAIIPCRLMIFVDGVPIKFGLEYGKSNYYSEVEIANNKNSITRLYLDEESLKKVNSKIDLEIMCIPMADNTEWNNENIMMACDNLIHTRETCNDFSESEIENKTKKTEMKHIKSTKDVVGRDLWEITRYTGHITDFILKGIDGKYYYVGDYRNDQELTTYFMLDGNFIETENGFYSIKWDGNDEYSVCELEVPEMDEGTHILLAVTIVNEEDSFSAYRSEGTIIEKE